MPLRIFIKEPHPMPLIVEGEIKDEDEKYWDGIFNNGAIMVKDHAGQNIVIPVWKESNVAFIQEVSEEQLEEQRKQMEEANQQGGKGSRIVKPDYFFPGRRLQGRGGGGFQL